MVEQTKCISALLFLKEVVTISNILLVVSPLGHPIYTLVVAVIFSDQVRFPFLSVLCIHFLDQFYSSYLHIDNETLGSKGRLPLQFFSLNQ